MRITPILIGFAFPLFAACSTEAPSLATDDQNQEAARGLYLQEMQDQSLAAEIDQAYAFVSTQYAAPSDEATELSALGEVLPENVSISWETVAHDATSGATTWQDFKLTVTIAGTPISLVAETLSAWALDTDLLIARIEGQRLGETAPLASRISAQNISLQGAAAFTENLISLWMSEFPDSGDFDTADLSFDRLDMLQESLVIDGLSLRPWEYVPVTPDLLPEDLAEDEEFVSSALPIGQSYLWWIALTRSLAIDAALSTNNRVQIGYGADAAELVGTYELARSFVYDMDGYDIRASYVDDVTFFQDVTINELAADDGSAFDTGPETLLRNFDFERTDSYRVGLVTGLELDKLMGYFARAELPSIDDRELMSLGQWHFEDINSIWFDEGLISIDNLTLEMDSFASFIPAVFDLKVEGATLDFDNVLNLGLRFGNYIISDTPDSESVDAEEAQAFVDALEKAKQKLPEFGFEQMTLDFSLEANWRPDAGDFSIGYTTATESFLTEEMQLDLQFPTYDRIVDALGADDSSNAFESLFEEVIAFLGFRYSLTDHGGIDRLMGLAQSIGADYQDEGWGAMLANMEPAQMRTTIATFVRLAQSEARTQFPPAVEWIESVAAFVETSGGQLEILVQPSDPLTADSFDAPEFEDEDVDWIVERLGIAVNHTPE